MGFFSYIVLPAMSGTGRNSQDTIGVVLVSGIKLGEAIYVGITIIKVNGGNWVLDTREAGGNRELVLE